MTQRITTLMTAGTMLTDINSALSRLSNSQQELATGRKINKPSDDPYGSELSINLSGQLSELTTYNSNITDATGWAQASDGALNTMTSMTQRVRELVIQAGNGTYSQSDLNASADEVDQLIDAVKQAANTQFGGQYVFAGTASTTAPYLSGPTDTYQGNTTPVNRLIGPGVTLQVSTDISQVLGSGTGAADGKLLDTLRTISADLRAGNHGALASGDLLAIDSNLDTLTQTQAVVGATENRLQLASQRIASIQDSVAQQLSNTQDADMAQVSVDFSTEQAAYQAALQAGAKIVQSSLVQFLQ